jgi:hypothetical protein
MTGSDMVVDGGISNADGGYPSTGIGRFLTDDPSRSQAQISAALVAIQNWNCLQRPIWRPTRHTRHYRRGASLSLLLVSALGGEV